jgi:hypothetical protein
VRSFRRSSTPAPQTEIADELRAVAGRLKGWSVYGAESVDLQALLRRAASEIDQAAKESGGETAE